MANKSTGKNYTSKGERKSSISTKNTDPAQRLLNQRAAQANGKRVVYTVPNPNKNETSRPFVRMMFDAKTPRGMIISPDNSRGVML